MMQPSGDLDGTPMLISLPLTVPLGWPWALSLLPCPCGKVDLEVGWEGISSFPTSASFISLFPGRPLPGPQTQDTLVPGKEQGTLLFSLPLLSTFQSTQKDGPTGPSWPAGGLWAQLVSCLGSEALPSLTLCRVRKSSEEVTCFLNHLRGHLG